MSFLLGETSQQKGAFSVSYKLVSYMQGSTVSCSVSYDWLRGDPSPPTLGEISSILINAMLRVNIHLMVSSARTKIERQDVQTPVSKSVTGIFYYPFGKICGGCLNFEYFLSDFCGPR